MTLTCHVTRENPGEDPPHLDFNTDQSCPVNLPESYGVVPYADEFAGDIKLKAIDQGTGIPDFSVNAEGITAEKEWLRNIHKVRVEKDGELQEEPVTFSGYFSNNQSSEVIRPTATIGVFPILNEKAASVGMQKHAMLQTMKATEFVNPGQIPVIVGDCPLYIQQKNASGCTQMK